MSVRTASLSEVAAIIGGVPDVLICSASFEARCRSIPDSVEPQTVRRVLVAENKNLSGYVGENARYLRARFADRASDVAMDTRDPLRSADSLRDALAEACQGGPQKWLVDITTFTHESLLILLKLLSLYLREEDTAWFVYVGASEYSVGLRDQEKWLSKGVVDVRSVLGFPGELVPSRGTHLVVLVGYEWERALALIDVFEPSLLSLGHGGKGTETDTKHRQAMEHFYRLLRAVTRFGEPVRRFDFSCSDPWEAKQALLEACGSAPELNVVVAPMNTKISTVGAALAAVEQERIQLCYAQASHYNYEQYSAPSDTCRLFCIPELFETRAS